MTHRLPLRKAIVSGAASRNPSRYKTTTTRRILSTLGDPPVRMTAPQKEAWATFAAELPWLNKSHRAIVRLACVVAAKVETSVDPGVNLLSAYSSILSKLGATPVDESRVSMPVDDGEDDDPKGFFQ